MVASYMNEITALAVQQGVEHMLYGKAVDVLLAVGAATVNDVPNPWMKPLPQIGQLDSLLLDSLGDSLVFVFDLAAASSQFAHPCEVDIDHIEAGYNLQIHIVRNAALHG